MHYFILLYGKIRSQITRVLIRQILGSWENTALPGFLVFYFIPRYFYPKIAKNRQKPKIAKNLIPVLLKIPEPGQALQPQPTDPQCQHSIIVISNLLTASNATPRVAHNLDLIFAFLNTYTQYTV